jgi:hypothetical protein
MLDRVSCLFEFNMLHSWYDQIYENTNVIQYRYILNIYSRAIYEWILLRGIQLTHVQRYWGSTVKMVLSYEIITLNEAITCVALPNACRRSVLALS